MMGQLTALSAQYLHISMNAFHVNMRQDYAVTLIVVRNFYMRRKTHDDLDVQELIRCQYQYISPHQDEETRFRRCMRRCAIENRKYVNIP